jgi:hypothetical protein
MLVAFFAISAKAAMSQPGKPPKQLASVKLRQNSTEQNQLSAPQVIASAAFLLLAFIALFYNLPLTKNNLVIEPAEPTFQCWFSPFLSVRPPPSF